MTDITNPNQTETMNYTVITYIIYLIVSIALTAWVARTLFRNGRIFLIDCFLGKEDLADSVNHLLVVGFYLVNAGFIALYLKLGMEIVGTQDLLEALSAKLGVVLLVLGAMHFGNILIFTKLRKRALLPTAPPPVPAAVKVEAPPLG